MIREYLLGHIGYLEAVEGLSGDGYWDLLGQSHFTHVKLKL